MKVIFVIVSMAGGGAERVISILANEMVKKGIEVSILMTAGDEVAYELHPAIRLHSAGGVSGGSMGKRLARIRAMRKVFRENPGAKIISFGPGTSFFAVAAAFGLGNEFVISERNDPAACPYPRLRNLIYGRGEAVVFQTADALQCFPERLKKKGVVIPNPISENLPGACDGERSRRIVAVGRLEPQKNHRLLLRAFALFHKEFPGYTLHLYGDGSLRDELTAFAKELGIHSHTFFEGFKKDILTHIRDAGMYVLSSDYEGVSNSLLEAMAIGLPSIATDCPIGGSKSLIRNRINGILVPVGDEKELKKAMADIASDDAFAESLSEKALLIRKEYSGESITGKWIEVLKQ